MNSFKPETLAAIENAVPQAHAAPALDVWRAAGGCSHQTVKMGLKVLVERGRVLRSVEIVRNRPLSLYRRTVA